MAFLKFPIAELPVGPGRLGLTCAPGTQDDRLAADVARIAEWGAVAIVTLIEASDGAAAIGEEARRRQIAWHHWPIRDFDVPDAAFEAAWPERSARLRQLLAGGGRVLVHCRGGLGRTGMLVARLLVDGGLEADAAMRAVRAVRPGAIETREQERWVGYGL